MDLIQIIHTIMLLFLAIGAVDYLLDGRLGLKEDFEEGIMTSGRLILCMAGFMVLAPVLARVLGVIASPLCRLAGMDPSVLAGMFLANDAGGAELALELADSREAGLYNGLIVGSMLGTTVMLGIPGLMIFTGKEERPSVIYGLLCGLATIPAGCLVGGTVAGFTAELIIRNTIPVFFVSAAILLALWFLGDRIISVFDKLGKLMTAVALLGLLCGAVESFFHITLIPGQGKLEEAFPVIGNISVFLAGAFPMIAVIRKVFSDALGHAARLFHTERIGISALILSLANSLAAIMLLRDMDDQGRLVNVAFLTSAGCMLGDHLAFTSQVAPEMCAAVTAGKLAGGIAALCVARLAISRIPGYGDK